MLPEIMLKKGHCVQTWHLAEWARLCSLTQRTQGSIWYELAFESTLIYSCFLERGPGYEQS